MNNINEQSCVHLHQIGLDILLCEFTAIENEYFQALRNNEPREALRKIGRKMNGILKLIKRTRQTLEDNKITKMLNNHDEANSLAGAFHSARRESEVSQGVADGDGHES